MKAQQRITITLAVMAIMSSCSKDTLLSLPPLDETDDVCEKMKDIKFMAYCYQNFDVNEDGKVSMTEASAVKTIECNDAADFTGIEYFSNLEEFVSHSAEIINLKYNDKLHQINCKDAPLDAIDLSRNTKLSEMSFENCKNLKEVIFSSDLTTISENAFANCKAIDTVICHASIPPLLQDNVFLGVNNAILKVPDETVNFYKYSEWSRFFIAVLPIHENIADIQDMTLPVDYTYTLEFPYLKCDNFTLAYTFGYNTDIINENNQDWATIITEADDEMSSRILALQENKSTDKRIASFIIKSSDQLRRITIVQYGNTAINNPNIISTDTIQIHQPPMEYWGGVATKIDGVGDHSLLTDIYVENEPHNKTRIAAQNGGGYLQIDNCNRNNQNSSYILEYDYSQYYRVLFLP